MTEEHSDQKKNKEKSKRRRMGQGSKLMFIDPDSCPIPIEYDTSGLEILNVDGVMVHVDDEEGRLMFFISVPSVGNADAELPKKILNRCLVELRMPKSIFMNITDSISEHAISFVERQEKSGNIIKKDGSQPMFG